jgi:hypothetical protein
MFVGIKYRDWPIAAANRRFVVQTRGHGHQKKKPRKRKRALSDNTPLKVPLLARPDANISLAYPFGSITPQNQT